MKAYNHSKIEKKWQKEWVKNNTYKETEGGEKPKAYVLDMFPYPSGAGLHVGHPKGYIATDVYSRFKKMSGYNVLHPMGWDAFGLPAENYALKNKEHPKTSTDKNVVRYKEQLSILGFSYDWDREINTTDPEYYKWTQWAFIQMFKKGLAFESHEPINWCPSCKTGLANEDLESDGTCERCGSQVEQKPLRQWVLKITEYADRLLEDLDTLERWPRSIKESQRNWIGRSEGAEFDFKVVDTDHVVKVFTTRADTIFGVTYAVLAPEHGLIHELESRIENIDEVKKYIDASKKKDTIERTAEGKEKTGVELRGVSVINPANGEKVPLWVADYVLTTYGTGAVMAVPAHDKRDFAFAQKYNLPIKTVVEPKFVSTSGDEAFRPDEKVVYRDVICAVVRNPKTDEFLCVSWKDHLMNGLVTGGIDDGEDIISAARREVLEETGYKNLRYIDRAPFAINTFFYHRVKEVNRHAHFNYVFFDLENEERDEVDKKESALHDVVWKKREELLDFLTVFEGDFMVNLINDNDYIYTDYGMLVNSGEFDGVDSLDAKDKIADKFGSKTVNYRLQDWVFSRQRYWGEPIPLVHCDKCGVVPVPEDELPVVLPDVESYEPSGTGESPLANIDEWVNVKCLQCGGEGKRETNTMPQWAGSCWYYLRYMDPQNKEALVDIKKEKYWAPVDLYVGGAEHATRHLIYARFWHKFLYDIGVVSTLEPFERLISVGLIMAEDGRKMSKRYGNVVIPDEVVDQVGADTMRVYEMFMGPFENAISWNTDGIVGSRRFIERVWRLQEKVSEGSVLSKQDELIINQTIKKVSEDIENFSMNTAVSQLMILLNHMESKDSISKNDMEVIVSLLSPFAPHVAEEIWSELGNEGSVYEAVWPTYDETKLVSDVVKLAVQVNGKVRATIEVPANMPENEIQEEALKNKDIIKWTEEKEVKKVIYVKGRVVNIVVA